MYEDRLLMRETAEFDQYCNMIPKCVQGMLQQPVFDRLAEIKTPTLVFYGNDDLLIPNRILHPKLSVEAVAKQGQEKLSQSQLVMVPQCGHFVLWDGAKTVVKSMQIFLNTK
jgi:pimeloyl-ACP methyl ester carboxylesterase